MGSGTPVLMARLPGIPDEYYDYVYIFDDRKKDGLARALRAVLDTDVCETADMGRRARSCVLRCKRNVTQAEKIIAWLRHDEKD